MLLRQRSARTSDSERFLRSQECDRAPAGDLYELSSHLHRLRSLGLSASYHDFEFVEHGQHCAIYSLELNRLLLSHNPPLSLRDERYRLLQEIRPLAAFLLAERIASGKTYFNQPKLRLLTDLTSDGVAAGIPVALGQTDYFSGLVTNDVTMKEVWSREHGCLLDGYRLLADENDVAYDIASSPCSNHCGVSSIAITSDRRLVVVAQSSKAAMYPSLLMPSASGSVEVSDADGAAGLHEFAANAIGRELREECGIAPEAVIRTRLIGYARHLDRGGKPELFGVSLLDVPFDELGGEVDVFTADVGEYDLSGAPVEQLPELLEAFRAEREPNFSFALYLNLAFLEHYLAFASDPFAGH